MNFRITGAMFIDDLIERALSSEAVAHPYLVNLREGTLPDVAQALKDFAFQYSCYSSGFVNYVDAVIECLSNDRHKKVLYGNLAEENGEPEPSHVSSGLIADVEGIPHSMLFRRFQESLGIDDEYRENTDFCVSVIDWRGQFLKLCKQDECVAVGALGIGTELLVSNIYSDILQAIKMYTGIQPKDYAFFSLHSECDDEHAEDLIKIAKDLATNDESCKKIAFGVESAIEMRLCFWQEMNERALTMSPSISKKENKELSFGY